MYKEIRDYVINKVTIIHRLSDDAFIPTNPNNSDYQAYLAWLAEGNTPLPPDEQGTTE